MDWPVTLGAGERSMMVVRMLSRVRASQNARQGPAMPAPEMRTFSLGRDILRWSVGRGNGGGWVEQFFYDYHYSECAGLYLPLHSFCSLL